MTSNRALIMINTKARSGDAEMRPVADILESKGIGSVLTRFETVGEIRTIIRKHLDDIDRIVVGGGDGTLSASIEDVLNSGLPLGILPLGTANDLARSLGIPFEIDKAAMIIAAGRIHRIDLGVVNGRHFFNAASIGLPVEVTHSLTGQMKKKWGDMSYLFAFLDAYRRNKPFRAEIVCEGKTHRVKSIQITIGNGRHYGGGMSIREDAAIDDHLLHCYSLEPQTLWEFVRAAPSIVRGTFEDSKRVRLMDGCDFQIATRKPMDIDVDGELTGRTPARFTVKKSILPVFVPAEAASAAPHE